MATLKTDITADASQFLKVIKDVLKSAEQAQKTIKDAFDPEVKIDNSSFKKAIADVEKTLKDLPPADIEFDVDKQSQKKIVDTSEDIGKKSGKQFTVGFNSILKGALAVSAIQGIGNIARDAVTGFVDLNKNVANIGTLGVENFEEFTNLALEASKTVPDSAANIAAGAYQAISAGITGTNEEIIKFTESASKVATAGLATTEEAVNGLTSVLNAYGKEASDVNEVSDTFFAAIKLGKTSFNELNAGLANVIPAASSAGIQFEEVAANIAQITALGVPTAQATTQLRGAIIELQKPGKELAEVMSGVTVEIDGVQQTLNESNIGQVLKEQGLTATLQQIQESAESSGKTLTQAFSSSEAASAALLLTGENAERANETLANVRKEIEGGVSTEAYEVAAQSLDAQLKILRNNVEGLFAEVLQAITPLISVITPLVQDLVGVLTSTLKPIIAELTPILDGIFSAIGELAGVLGGLLAEVAGSIAKLLAPLGKLLIPIIQALSKVLDELSPVITEIIDIVVELVGALLTALEPILTVILDVFVDLIKVAIKPLLPLLKALTPIITTFAKVLELVSLIIAPIIGLLGEFIISLFELRNEALEPVIEFIESLVKNLTELYDTAISFITDIGKTLGLIDDKETEVKIETNAKEVKEEVEELNNVEAAEIEATIKPVAPDKDKTKKTVADLSKFITDLFESNPIQIKTDFELSDIGIDEALDFFNNGTALTGDKDLLAEINLELEKIAELKSTIAETDQFIELQIEGKDKIISDLSGIRDETDDVLDKLENKRVDLFSQLNTDITPEKRSEILREIDVLNDKILKRTIETAKDSNLTKEQLEDATNERLRQLKIASTEALNKEILDKEKALNDLKAEFTSTSERDLQKLRLELSDETNENLKQKEIFQAEERFADLLNKFRDSEEAKLLIRKAYDDELRAIDKKYAVTVTSLYEDIAKTFAESLSSYDTSNIVAKNKEIEDSISSVKSEYESETEALNEQLKNREISYSEYNAKIVELEAEKNDKLKELEDQRFGFVDIINDQLTESFKKLAENVKESFAEQSQAVIGYQDKLADYQKQLEDGVITELEYNELTTQAQKDKEEALTASYEAIAVASGATLASLIADGESFTTALAKTALEGLQALVPVFIAEIFGQSLGQLGPIAGPAVAGALTATLQGLIAVAQSSIGGANDGVIGLNQSNKGKPKGNDSILMMLAPNESVITSSGTAKNKPYLEFINKGGSMSDLINPNVYSSDMSETNKRLDNTTKEISELRKDMRKLRVDHFYDKQPKVYVNNKIELKSSRGVL